MGEPSDIWLEKADPALMKGLNTYGGNITFRGVAEAHGMDYVDPATLF